MQFIPHIIAILCLTCTNVAAQKTLANPTNDVLADLDCNWRHADYVYISAKQEKTGLSSITVDDGQNQWTFTDKDIDLEEYDFIEKQEGIDAQKDIGQEVITTQKALNDEKKSQALYTKSHRDCGLYWENHRANVLIGVGAAALPLAFWFPPIAPACAQVIGANVLWKCALSPLQWLNNRAKKNICAEHKKVDEFLSGTHPQEKSIAQANHVQLLEAAFQDTTQDAFIQALQTILDNKTR